MSETKSYPYATFLDIKFPALTLVDVPSLVKACNDKWYNQTLCKVNDSVVRLGVMQGEYHWHKHDRDDEFFFVLEGHFIIDLEDRSVDLEAAGGIRSPEGPCASHSCSGTSRYLDGGKCRHCADGDEVRNEAVKALKR
jgi:Mannose-6-phosphate isomerase